MKLHQLIKFSLDDKGKEKIEEIELSTYFKNIETELKRQIDADHLESLEGNHQYKISTYEFENSSSVKKTRESTISIKVDNTDNLYNTN